MIDCPCFGFHTPPPQLVVEEHIECLLCQMHYTTDYATRLQEPTTEPVELNSSNLAAAAYANNTLRILFHNGSVYEYSDVPEETYSTLLAAPSQGGFFNSYIKTSFPTRRIWPKPR